LTRYLLDTNILSDVIRNPHGRISARIHEFGEDSVCTSVVVAAELRYGVAKRGSERLTAQVEAILGALEVLPLETPADAIYGRVRTQLERLGQVVGGNDLLIAAHAMTLGHTLVTDNERELSRIPGLTHVNWLDGT
jgi:tRNA(fMet)-specific endonuclease VapC